MKGTRTLGTVSENGERETSGKKTEINMWKSGVLWWQLYVNLRPSRGIWEGDS